MYDSGGYDQAENQAQTTTGRSGCFVTLAFTWLNDHAVAFCHMQRHAAANVT